MSRMEESVIVYVEDDKTIQEQISRVLRRWVKEIYVGNNGEEGLEQVKEHDPDLVLTDLEMPVMNGLEMIKKIREIYGENKPIIVLTGYDDDEHYTELADAYIYKPIEIDILKETIKNKLENLK